MKGIPQSRLFFLFLTFSFKQFWFGAFLFLHYKGWIKLPLETICITSSKLSAIVLFSQNDNELD